MQNEQITSTLQKRFLFKTGATGHGQEVSTGGIRVILRKQGLLLLLLLQFGDEACGQAPANDNFADAEVLTGDSGAVFGDNAEATLELDEPTALGGLPTFRSVWYSWEAPESSLLSVRVVAEFDTQLAVVTEGADNAFETAGESDMLGAGGLEELLLQTEPGRSYWFRVSSADDLSGEFIIEWDSLPPLPNDAFAQAQLIAGVEDFGSLLGTNVTATMEQDEPSETAGWESGSSVWYLWEAPATGTFSIRARGDFDTQLTLFEGKAQSPLGDLTLLDQSDPQDFSGDSLVTWDAIDGVRYWLRVTGYLGEAGDFTLDWSIHPAFQPVYTFAASTGRLPQDLFQGADGNFYGISSIGGENDRGTIFRLTPEGEATTLAEFTGSDGPTPGDGASTTLLQCRDGDFYGITSLGRQDRFFTMTPGGEFTTLFEFPEDVFVEGGLVQGRDGDFYGTTVNGGEAGQSTVFRISPTGTFTLVAIFPAEVAPESTMVEGPDGNFYGTTEAGGAQDAGMIFRVTREGTITTLFEFGDRYGTNVGPYVMVKDQDGTFYGTTAFGGDAGQGSVFQFNLEGAYTEIVAFDGTNAPQQGIHPFDGLTRGADGSLYGTTKFGGSAGEGTVFRVSTTGALSTLVAFTGRGGTAVGSSPNGLVLGSNGELYGTTETGGFESNDVGTAFRVDPDGTFTTLVDFASLRGGGAGAAPLAALVLGSDGDFYGTTYYDGATDSGTVFRITPAGIITRLAEFTGTGGPLPGRGPLAPLVEGQDGEFFGMTSRGGIQDRGTIFRMSPSGSVSTLFEFDEPQGNPQTPLTQGIDGHFYGTTLFDGASASGTIFRITSDGAFTTLIEFNEGDGSVRGAQPGSALTLAANGDLWGTTRTGGLNGAGTVFRISPEGAFATVVDFSGEDDPAPGAAPLGALLLGSDGYLYGTTSAGGPQDQGTVFRINPAGEFSSLFAFGGNEAEDHGSAPAVALVEGGDGNFYGTAAPGGRFENSTVYMMTPAGVVTTFHEFDDDEAPRGPLVTGPDGDLYGVQEAAGTAGQIYRMVFRGIPSTYLLAPPEPGEGLTRTSATVRSSVNPRGALVTGVQIEYGTDGSNFPSTLAIPISLSGYRGIPVGRTLENLEAGMTYYYRFRVSSDLGESVSETLTFSTLIEPEVSLAGVSEVSPTSARLNGVVNARNFDAVVSFEYGPDGNSFLNSVPVETTPAGQGLVSGNTDTGVSAPIAGLEAGRTYYYRLVATSTGGFAVSGQGSFRTLTPPVSELMGAEALSTTRARVQGSVDALGSEVTAIYFEYWSEGQTVAEATLETATPAAISGEGPITVSATLTGLTQGTTYNYRIRAVGAGGSGLSETGTFSLSLLSGLEQAFPDPPAPPGGEVTIVLGPANLGGWRFAGEGRWRDSGELRSNLASGDRRVEYRPVAGYIQPPSELISVASGESVELQRDYFTSPATGAGALTISLVPVNLASTDVPEQDRAQWRFLGESTWLDSGVVREELAPGLYLIESKPVDGRVTPPTTSVLVEDGNLSTLTLTFFASNQQTGEGPEPASFADASSNEDLPLAYLGQIQSPAGGSTGFVVKRRVVATAGHVVFDDGSLSFITDLQWLFQRHSPEYEPTPQTPRGFYLAAGYAEARQQPGVEPGVGTPQSQDLDYAVLYFQEEAGRGGVAGFLASDAMDENEFLSSTSDKMLAGYPVDGISAQDVGKVHATPVFDAPLTPAFGETWTTADVHGTGGLSGGPLFTRHSNGSFYPAAIYLGGAGQAVVRAIDSDVVELFLRAETSGNGGENNTGGGITHTSVAGNLNASQPGALRVLLAPTAVNGAGAGWQLVPESRWRPGGSRNFNMRPGSYRLQFREVAGFDPPAPQTVVITGGQLSTITFNYEERSVAGPLETWRETNFGTTLNSEKAADDADPDLDGMTNIREYVAGTDPNNPADFLALRPLSKTGSTFSAECNGKAGRIYTLQRNSGLNTPWTALSSEGPLASDGTVSLIDQSAPGGAAYYRVEVSVPQLP